MKYSTSSLQRVIGWGIAILIGLNIADSSIVHHFYGESAASALLSAFPPDGPFIIPPEVKNYAAIPQPSSAPQTRWVRASCSFSLAAQQYFY